MKANPLTDSVKITVRKPEREATFAAPTGSAWYPLFKHMSDEYQMTMLDGELSEIASKADESRMKSGGRGDMVRWALVNALYHLDTDQLHELGEAIAKRSGGTYAPNSDYATGGSDNTRTET